MKGSLSDNWKKWKQVWDSYEIIANLKTRSSEYRIATLIICIGPEALGIFKRASPLKDQKIKI